MSFCIMKNIVFLIFFCYIKLNSSHDGIAIPFKCSYTDTNLKIHFRTIRSPLYYNPVDTDWKKEKCNSLGFTYKEPNKKHMFTPYTIPSELFYSTVIPILLSELICGDKKFMNHFARNIVKNLKSNENIEKLFETKEMFDNYIAKTTKIEQLAVQINGEDCPICYESKRVSYVLDYCNHQLCDICADKLLIKRNYTCPLCRAHFNQFLENGAVN
ncbi:uncharacterized protein LOC126896882 isoform X2 [Daktulosphaira vitifoliae]|uniref:uncharacterized protein LOC126896882 isoform X2 n=1 Tax=Daktulosphaira vitifoliae TaxID=58002 RepID=UPI0021AA19B9|nr:uncharacterized protein LOC126896882 isoform X2 [Daktulosphaira vitifoliae]